VCVENANAFLSCVRRDYTRSDFIYQSYLLRIFTFLWPFYHTVHT
jgi:hypothetical protein